MPPQSGLVSRSSFDDNVTALPVMSNFDNYILPPSRAKNWRSQSAWARATSPALISFITGWISWHFMKVFQHISVR